MLKWPTDEILNIVRGHSDPRQAWSDILALCRLSAASALWDALPKADIARDIEASADWLSAELSSLSHSAGIYLGLDTLNMEDGNGYNVEIGRALEADPFQVDVSWLLEGLSYGNNHLIHGLYELHNVYSRPEWGNEVFTFADYVLFLAYSGIVLGQGLVRLRGQQPLLAVWGFHDGDLFVLGRKTPEKFEFVCQPV